jgi:hypothetical protein
MSLPCLPSVVCKHSATSHCVMLHIQPQFPPALFTHMSDEAATDGVRSQDDMEAQRVAYEAA